jgi:hypothetical protein
LLESAATMVSLDWRIIARNVSASSDSIKVMPGEVTVTNCGESRLLKSSPLLYSDVGLCITPLHSIR